MGEPLYIERGTLMLYYCFDVGDEILLDRIEKIFGETPVLSRLAYERLTPEYVKYRKEPLLIKMGTLDIEIADSLHSSTCQAKLYDFGVATITFKIPLHETLHGLVGMATSVVGNAKIQQTARAQLDRLLLEISDEVVQSPNVLNLSDELEWEDYAIFSVERFNRPMLGKELLAAHAGEIAKILRSEAEPLSEWELADATKQALSYYQDELAIIDWNAAFLYDPRQSYDVPDVLEYAVAMLLELRTYDALLDHALDKAYDDLEKRQRSMSPRPFSPTINYLLEVKLDVSEVIEKATNSLKLIGDLYLARVYSVAAARFSLPTWESSVQEKLTTVQDLYMLLHQRTQDRLLLMLELVIVFLFVLDIILLFLWPALK
ncbi:hypothetical protein HY229_00940 [Candidatus Acetothermia bacterium]|nr:hypothetical protein [Candidatus Acetothermia bacterium]MBI3642656.1 hypothetical protein [Candidatus Acetothermia bacterium]